MALKDEAIDIIVKKVRVHNSALRDVEDAESRLYDANRRAALADSALEDAVLEGVVLKVPINRLAALSGFSRTKVRRIGADYLP